MNPSRNRRVADRELRRQAGGHGSGHRAENAPRDVRAAVLLRKRLADVVLGGGAPLDEEGSEPSAREALDGEGAGHALLADGAGAEKDRSESGHWLSIIA